MRYLLTRNNTNEQKLRQEFLFDAFHLWFVKNGEIGDYDILQSFPFHYNDDILVIYGHNYSIKQLFEAHSDRIYENNIFIISCSLDDNRDYLIQGKQVFLAPQINRRVQLLRGTEFGFSFDITEAELGLYNSHESDIFSKLISIFEPISKKGW